MYRPLVVEDTDAHAEEAARLLAGGAYAPASDVLFDLLRYGLGAGSPLPGPAALARLRAAADGASHLPPNVRRQVDAVLPVAVVVAYALHVGYTACGREVRPMIPGRSGWRS